MNVTEATMTELIGQIYSLNSTLQSISNKVNEIDSITKTFSGSSLAVIVTALVGYIIKYLRKNQLQNTEEAEEHKKEEEKQEEHHQPIENSQNIDIRILDNIIERKIETEIDNQRERRFNNTHMNNSINLSRIEEVDEPRLSYRTPTRDINHRIDKLIKDKFNL